MTGKEKCAFLKSLRKSAAYKYGIDMEFPECTHRGECSGTCPACEKELDELNAAIKALSKEEREAAEKDGIIKKYEEVIEAAKELPVDSEDRQPIAGGIFKPTRRLNLRTVGLSVDEDDSGDDIDDADDDDDDDDDENIGSTSASAPLMGRPKSQYHRLWEELRNADNDGDDDDGDDGDDDNNGGDGDIADEEDDGTVTYDSFAEEFEQWCKEHGLDESEGVPDGSEDIAVTRPGDSSDNDDSRNKMFILNFGEGRGTDLHSLVKKVLEPVRRFVSVDDKDIYKALAELNEEKKQQAKNKAPVPAGRPASHLARFLADGDDENDENSKIIIYDSDSGKGPVIYLRDLLRKMVEPLRKFVVMDDEEYKKFIDELEEQECLPEDKKPAAGKAFAAGRTSRIVRFLEDDSSVDGDDESEGEGEGNDGDGGKLFIRNPGERSAIHDLIRKVIDPLRNFITVNDNDIEGYLADDGDDDSSVVVHALNPDRRRNGKMPLARSKIVSAHPDDEKPDDDGDGDDCGEPEDEDGGTAPVMYPIMGLPAAMPEDDDDDGEDDND